MFKEIKIVEQHYTADGNKHKSKECENPNGKLGSEELESLDKEYKHLVSKEIITYPCRKYNAVTFVVTSYLFSKHKIESNIVNL